MNIQNFFQSKYFKWVLVSIGALILLLLVFQAGVFVGFRKAGFSFKWGDNYHRAFGGPRNGFLRDFEGRDFISGHGTAGTIAKIDANSFVIKDQSGVEKIVNFDSSTSIKKGNVDVSFKDIKVDDRVVVIGTPKDDGSIEAKIIRVFDGALPPPHPDFNFNKGSSEQASRS